VENEWDIVDVVNHVVVFTILTPVLQFTSMNYVYLRCFRTSKLLIIVWSCGMILAVRTYQYCILYFVAHFLMKVTRTLTTLFPWGYSRSFHSHGMTLLRCAFVSDLEAEFLAMFKHRMLASFATSWIVFCPVWYIMSWLLTGEQMCPEFQPLATLF
jgi:hypothetical protein